MVGTLLGWPLVVAKAADTLREVEMGMAGGDCSEECTCSRACTVLQRKSGGSPDPRH